MTRQIQYIVLVLLFCGCQSATKVPQTTENLEEPAVLFTVDQEPVFSKEFQYVYKKNNTNNDSAFTKKDIDDYLDLYKKFKLKIAEAKSQGIDTTKTFVKEFNTYKDQLKKPYLTESKVTEKLIKEAYNRYSEEINASHILIKVGENATPADTLAAYKKALEVKDLAEKKVKPFDKLAKEYSDDPSAARNGGNLGYFTSFQMVYPFETAAYKTPEESISDPIRTRFGYHLVKVLDKRPAQGSVTVSHLMIRLAKNGKDSIQARNKIFELYDQALGGANWQQLIEQFSEDINTKSKGGVLPPFKVGQMPYSFQEAAFALQERGAFSDPVMTPFGWHIIRFESRKPLESLEELETSIRARIKRDSRADINRRVLINRLKEENGFSTNQNIYSEINAYVDSVLSGGEWAFNEKMSLLNERLFSIGEVDYRVEDFFSHLNKEDTPQKSSYQLLEEFESEKIIDFEENHLEEKYYDYKMLVKEYREGIMLFQLMEDEVWKKAVDDSVGLRSYYEKNKQQYKWEKRVKAIVYNSASEEVINEISTLVEQGDSLAWSKKELETTYNHETPLTLQVQSGLYELGDNLMVDKVDWTEGLHSLQIDNRFVLIHVENVKPPEVKPFNKIKGLVISDYQNQLEKEWLAKLGQKYSVEVNKNVLNDVYKALIKK